MNQTPARVERPPFIRTDRPHQLLIGGRWVMPESGKTIPVLDPSTGRSLGSIAQADARDVERAVAAARDAMRNGPWSTMKPYDRQRLLLRLADLVESNFEELAALETFDMGAPISRTLAFKRHWVGRIRYYAGIATTVRGETIENSLRGDYFSYTVKEPVGVVGAIVPWNGPVGLGLLKLAPALAVGCAVVLKPSEEASLSLLRLGELIVEAGYPDGTVNIVTGLGDVGAAIASHPGIDKVSFTGSTRTGQAIIAASAADVKRLSLELGGKSPNIIFDDADLDAAVKGASIGIFSNSGQMCFAGSRLFVQRGVFEQVTQRLCKMASSLRLGPTADPATQLGPVINGAQLDRVRTFLDEAVAAGADVRVGGERRTDGELADGNYMSPAVVVDVTDDMRIVKEEIFGPVVCILPFDTEDEVVARANASKFGLSGGVWTRDIKRGHRVAHAIQAGTIWVNCYLPLDPSVPFGGYKMSGYGLESGIGHLDEFLHTKSVISEIGAS